MGEKEREWGGMMFPGSFSPLLPHSCSLSPRSVDGCQPLLAPRQDPGLLFPPHQPSKTSTYTLLSVSLTSVSALCGDFPLTP